MEILYMEHLVISHILPHFLDPRRLYASTLHAQYSRLHNLQAKKPLTPQAQSALLLLAARVRRPPHPLALTGEQIASQPI